MPSDTSDLLSYNHQQSMECDDEVSLDEETSPPEYEQTSIPANEHTAPGKRIYLGMEQKFPAETGPIAAYCSTYVPYSSYLIHDVILLTNYRLDQ